MIKTWCIVIMFNAIIGLIQFFFVVPILCVMPQSRKEQRVVNSMIFNSDCLCDSAQE